MPEPVETVAAECAAVTPAALIARAEAMRPRLRDLQADTERRGYYAAETHQAFLDAGFYRILQPRQFGGFEFGLDTFWKVMVAVARGCPSTGWCLTLGAAHTLQVASYFPEDVQARLFAGGQFIAPLCGSQDSTLVAVPEGGGYRLSGTYRYCSGIPYATHFMGFGRLPGVDPSEPIRFVLVVVPRGQYTMLDDWGDILGLRGSGSNSVVIDNAFVPEGFVVPLNAGDPDLRSGSTPGLRAHGNPLYAGQLGGVGTGELVVSQLGAAQAMLDWYEDYLRTTTTRLDGPPVPRYQHRDYQRYYGEALSSIQSAEVIMWRAGELYTEYAREGAEGGHPFDLERAAQLSGLYDVVGRLTWQAGDILFRTASSSAARDGHPMQRYWRDLSTFHNNATHQPDQKAARTARLHFGLPAGGIG